MDLFPDVLLEDGSYAKHNEQPIEYLAHSTRVESRDVKKFLEGAFARYPDHEKNELKIRLYSKKLLTCKAAVFELILHELFCRLGFKITVHPEVPFSSSKPDFFVEIDDQTKFYLEALIASNGKESMTLKQEQARLFDEINSHFSFVDNASLGIFIRAQSERTISKKDLFKEIRSKLEIFNKSNEPVSSWTWLDLERGWEIALTLHRASYKYERFISTMDGEGGFPSVAKHIKRALKRKNSKYGTLLHPLVLAIDLFTFHTEFAVEMDALFGSQIGINERMYTGRTPNGVLNNKHGPQYSSYSAIWIFDEITSWKLNKRGCMYLHPWAQTSLPEKVWTRFSHAKPILEAMVYAERPTVYEMLGLCWPWYKA